MEKSNSLRAVNGLRHIHICLGMIYVCERILVNNSWPRMPGEELIDVVWHRPVNKQHGLQYIYVQPSIHT